MESLLSVKREFKPRRKTISKKIFEDGSIRYRYGYEKRDVVVCFLKKIIYKAINNFSKRLPSLMFFLFFICFYFLIKESNYTLWSIIDDTFLERYFLASIDSVITLSIVTGILSGSFIWFFDVYIPKSIQRRKKLECLQIVSNEFYKEAQNVHEILSKAIIKEFRSYLLDIDSLNYQSMCDVFLRESQNSLILDEKKLESLNNSFNLYSLYTAELFRYEDLLEYELSLYIQKLNLAIKSFIASSEDLKCQIDIVTFLRLHGDILKLLSDRRFMTLNCNKDRFSYEFKILLAKVNGLNTEI